MDPHLHRTRRRVRLAGGESFRARGIGRGEHGRPRRNAPLGQAVMNVIGREQSQTAVVMFVVIPGEEDMAVGPGILDRAEAVREGRAVLERLDDPLTDAR